MRSMAGWLDKEGPMQTVNLILSCMEESGVTSEPALKWFFHPALILLFLISHHVILGQHFPNCGLCKSFGWRGRRHANHGRKWWCHLPLQPLQYPSLSFSCCHHCFLLPLVRAAGSNQVVMTKQVGTRVTSFTETGHKATRFGKHYCRGFQVKNNERKQESVLQGTKVLALLRAETA